MTDAEKREKVIKALRACYPADVKWCQARVKGQCDYNVAYCRMALFKDAAELLEAQEPREPTLDIRRGKSMWRCGSCSTALQPNQMNAKFCFNCGQAVKWNG